MQIDVVSLCALKLLNSHPLLDQVLKMASIEHVSTDRQIADLLTKGLGESTFLPLRDLLMGWTPRKLLDHKGELKESDIRPREIPSPKDSVFLANMRSHKKVFHRLAEFGKMLRGPGANSLEGVENDLRSTKNGQNESHLQDHLDEQMTPDSSSKCPR